MSSRIQKAFRLILLICLWSRINSRSYSYRIRSQSTLSMSFKSNDFVVVALSLGLAISNPSGSIASNFGLNPAPAALITKSKVLIVEPIDLNEVKSSRVKPLYEEVKYNKALTERNAVKRAYDSTINLLRETKSDLNSAQLVLKKYETRINQMDKLIRSAKDSKESQALYKEQGDLRNSVTNVCCTLSDHKY